MNGLKLQAKIYKGYGLAAKRIGFPYDVHRPADPLHPIGAALATLPASFNQEFSYRRPNKYGVATWMGIFDASACLVGDYLIGRQGTFFIAAMQDTLPLFMVQTNRVVSVLRVGMDSGVGQIGYGGATAANEVPMLSGWPASVLQGTKGERNEVLLPGDVRTPWWLILLPAWPGVVLRTSDVISDDLNRRYIVSSAELTDMGWRITAMQAQV